MKTHLGTIRGKRIFVGLSGGVDSSVSAALLKEAGALVTGVFIRTWHPEGFPCSEGEDEREAMRVAAHLDIPFRTLDLSERYRIEVGQKMIDGYARGETPNPDTLCNREVKFGGFIEFAKREGADAIATGHYAQLRVVAGEIVLTQAPDEQKDQSYFLALVPHDQFSYTLFPVGGMDKTQVRAHARRYELPNALRKDSQGICFLGALDLRSFLSKYIPLTEGDVLTPSGEKIGVHAGAALYTLGERHGFFVEAKRADTEPLYILETNITKNTITVGPKSAVRGSHSVILRSCVSHTGRMPKQCSAVVRYHGKKYDAALTLLEEARAEVVFTEEVLVAVGQVVVLFDADRIVFAGIVETKQ